MKKIMVVLLFVLLTFSFSDVDLKGFVLGSTFTDLQRSSVEEYNKGTYMHFTTLGGVEGYLVISCLNDGRIYDLSFIPSKGGEPTGVWKTDIERFVKGISAKFQLDLKYVADKSNSDEKDGKYSALIDNVSYSISIDDNPYKTPCYYVVVNVNDIALTSVSKTEKRKNAIVDF